MSVQATLIKPWVIEPTTQHTHTMIFVQKFSQTQTECQIWEQLVCHKICWKRHSLRQHFPSMKWVFPHGKIPSNGSSLESHTNVWEPTDLSSDERTAVNLNWGKEVPYLTQIILNEAQLIGGTDKIILGGQGIGAVAAQRALQGFDKPPIATPLPLPEGPREFIHTYVANVSGLPKRQVKIAGFFNMHDPTAYYAEPAWQRTSMGLWLLKSGYPEVRCGFRMVVATTAPEVRNAEFYTIGREKELWSEDVYNLFEHFLTEYLDVPDSLVGNEQEDKKWKEGELVKLQREVEERNLVESMDRVWLA
ncbi:hypothetical protein F5Y18DRAFT_300712 [Xylariaceae sp. FL1019]|nr:hypothetical protein F5Y18DRAFT_300712 [Xylariaceae sp. FL1019]